MLRDQWGGICSGGAEKKMQGQLEKSLRTQTEGQEGCGGQEGHCQVTMSVWSSTALIHIHLNTTQGPTLTAAQPQDKTS